MAPLIQIWRLTTSSGFAHLRDLETKLARPLKRRFWDALSVTRSFIGRFLTGFFFLTVDLKTADSWASRLLVANSSAAHLSLVSSLRTTWGESAHFAKANGLSALSQNALDWTYRFDPQCRFAAEAVFSNGEPVFLR